MATIKFTYGDEQDHANYIGEENTISVDTEKKTLRVHDGVTPGGSTLATEEQLEGFVSSNVEIVAGDGLVGGGSLDGDAVTISVGTPSTITGTTINESSGNSHSHAISLTKNDVGLSNVDNTSDLNKPISTATQTALNTKLNTTDAVTSVAGRKGAVTLTKNDVGLSNVDNTSDLNKPISTATQTALNTKLNSSQVGVSVASLVNGKVPLSQMDDSILGQVEYKGTWDAATNTPTIPVTPTEKGIYYVVSTGGTFQSISFAVGDWIISNGSVWQKVDNTDAVTSVAGKTGAVTLTKSDVGLSNVDNTSDLNKPISTATQTALNAKLNTADAVTSVAGRKGAVTLTKSDVGLSNVDNTSDLNKPISTATQTALNAKAPLNSPVFTGTPEVPTQAASDNSKKVANTEFVKAVVDARDVGVTSVSGTAPINVSGGTSTPTISISPATQSSAGSMSAVDKAKLDGIQAGAEQNTVDSVAGKTGDVALSASDIGGLGTAATANLTTSAFDTTAGRVLKNGDWGIPTDINMWTTPHANVGGDATGTDLNTLTTAGWWRKLISPSSINKPSGGSGYWYLLVLKYATGTNVTQVAFPYGTGTNGNIQYRSQYDGTWSAWRTLYDSNNTLNIGATTSSARTVLGISNVDNTSDLNKPISTATQNALNLKADLNSPAFTGTPTVPTQLESDNSTKIATTEFVKNVVAAQDTGVSSVAGVAPISVGGTASVPEVSISNATTSASGAMSAADKAKLDGIAAGAQVNTVNSVAGKTGAVALTKTDVGLSNVDNTSDLNKPISTATQTALNLKANLSSPAFTGTPTVPTQLSSDNSTKVASTAFVKNVVAAHDIGVSSVAGVAPISVGGTASVPEVSISNATTSVAGAMSAADKAKLDGIAAGAQVNTVTSVAGKTGAVTLSKTDVGLANVDNTSDLDKPISSATQAALSTKVNNSSVGVLVASLVNGKVPLSQIDDSILGQVEYMGVWDASANNPTLPATPTEKGQYYVTSVAGTFQSISFAVGDWIISNGSVWQKVDNTDAVTSVAGKTGVVTLTKTDVGLSNVDNTSDAAKPISTATQTALNLKANLSSPAFTGTPTVPTQPVADNSTKVASTAFVKTALDSHNIGVSSVAGVAPISVGGTASVPEVSISNATTSVAGAMSAADKAKLDGIAAGAQVNVGTNLTQGTRTATSVPVTSSTGSAATLAAATATLAGVMSAADKAKLDGIAAGAQVNTVTSVAGKTGAISLVKADVGLSNVDNTSDAAKPVSTATQTALNAKLDTSEVGSTVASLVGGKVPLSQINDSIIGQVEYMGVWNAATNSPTLPKTPTEKGHYYVTSVAGTFQSISYAVGDWIISNGVSWDKVDNTDAVSSVAGKTGAVTLTKTDVGLSNVDNTSDLNKPISTATQTALNLKANLSSPAFTGTPTVPTQPVADNSTKVASTEFVKTVVAAHDIGVSSVSGVAPISVGGTAATPEISISNATTSVSGAMSAADKAKLDGIAAGAQVNTVTSVAGKTGAVTLAKADVGLGSVDNTSDATKSIGGNAATATKLATARTIGGVSFDGTANINLPGVNTAGNQSTSGNAATATKLATSRTINGVAFDGTTNITINAVDTTARIAASEKGAANGVATLDANGMVPAGQLPSYVDDVLEFADQASFPTTGETGKIYIAVDTGKIYRWTGTVYVNISANASTADAATKLATARTISITGDATWSTSFDGSANATGALTLANSGVTAGTYPKVTVDAKGRVTSGAVLAATDVPALDASKITTGTIAAARIPTLDQNTTGNAATATKLATARTINGVSFDGSANIVIGADWANITNKLATARTINGVSFDGSANIVIGADWANITNKPATYAPSTHTHVISEVTGLQGALDGKVSLTGDQSVAGVKTFSTALAVTGTSKAAGRFYAGTTDPSNTTRTNYDGKFHATGFGSGRFVMEYNAATESLDFNFI